MYYYVYTSINSPWTQELLFHNKTYTKSKIVIHGAEKEALCFNTRLPI